MSLADTIHLEAERAGWRLVCDDDTVPQDETNLCVRAYSSLRELFPDLKGVRIHLKKKIPVGAGLGGGSSNAAAVLKGVAELHALNLSDGRLQEIAGTIGADVPFFIRGGTQYAEGIGEVLSPASLPPMKSVLLVVPQRSISTSWAYGRIKNHLTGGFESGKFAAASRITGAFKSVSSWEAADKFFENDFESLVSQTYPEIGDIHRQLKEAGALFASLSGSGSTVFGIFHNVTEAREAAALFSPVFQTFVTYPILKD